MRGHRSLAYLAQHQSPVLYRGFRLRSHQVRNWARFFDGIGAHWLPPEAMPGIPPAFADFLLTVPRQFVTVRSHLTDDHSHLIGIAPRLPRRLSRPQRTDDELDATPDIPLVVCGPEGTCFGIERTGRIITALDLELAHCLVCDGWWFMAGYNSWRCQCCGHYDGNADVDRHFPPFPQWAALTDDLAEAA